MLYKTPVCRLPVDDFVNHAEHVQLSNYLNILPLTESGILRSRLQPGFMMQINVVGSVCPLYSSSLKFVVGTF